MIVYLKRSRLCVTTVDVHMFYVLRLYCTAERDLIRLCFSATSGAEDLAGIHLWFGFAMCYRGAAVCKTIESAVPVAVQVCRQPNLPLSPSFGRRRSRARVRPEALLQPKGWREGQPPRGQSGKSQRAHKHIRQTQDNHLDHLLQLIVLCQFG